MNQPSQYHYGRWGGGWRIQRKYDIVSVDAYRLPYIPWHDNFDFYNCP